MQRRAGFCQLSLYYREPQDPDKYHCHPAPHKKIAVDGLNRKGQRMERSTVAPLAVLWSGEWKNVGKISL